MTLDDTIRKCIFEYPSLYKDVSMQKSRIKVLDHLFLVIGNGFEWHDGYLYATSNEDVRTGKIKMVKPKKYGKEKFDKKLDEKYFATPIYREFHHHPDLMKLIKADPKFSDLALMEEISLYVPTPYPVCEFSAIVTAPDNIRADWLAGAIEAAEWALSFYTGPKEQLNQLNYQKVMNYKPEVINKLATKHPEVICKSLTRLRALAQKSKTT